MAINREQFITRMAKNGNTTKKACREYVDLMLRTFLELLREGEVIKFQRIMRVEAGDVAEKETYNIATGDRFVIPAHKCIRVRISRKLQEKFNKEQ